MNAKFKYSTCNPKRPLPIIFPTHQSVRNVMYHTIVKQDQFVYINVDGIAAYNSSPILFPNTVICKWCHSAFKYIYRRNRKTNLISRNISSSWNTNYPSISYAVLAFTIQLDSHIL